MTAPTTPYCTWTLATLLSLNMFKGRTPTINSPIDPTTGAQLITWVDSLLQGDFHSVGYKIPFQAISGETWPTFQTTLLQYASAMGAMAMATGYILAPAPQLVAGRTQGERNAYAILIESFRNEIRTHGFRFRAQYYNGTKAEKMLATRYGPQTDFMKDRFDPTRFELFRAYTDRMVDVFEDVQDYQIEWDYMYQDRA